MNREQQFTVSQAEAQVRQVRRTIDELEGFGWKPTETTKPLATFDTYRGRLSLNQANIQTADPAGKQLAALLSEENLLVESVSKLASEAASALRDEERAFFQAREGILENLAGQIDEADEQIQSGLSWLIDGLQARWKLMEKKQELAQRFADISQAHNTPESFGVNAMRLPKPFLKLHNESWHALVASFLGRLSATLPNFEETEPADAVKTIYER